MKFNKSGVIFFSLGLSLIGNFVFAQGLTPNDPFYSKQWYLDKLKMPDIWSQESGQNNVVIAVIDSGIDISHPDLHDNIWVNQKEILGDGIDNDHNGYVDDGNGWDFINNNNDPSPKYENDCLSRRTCMAEAISHGTFVAGVAAAVGNNGIGITGIGWQIKIMPLRVLNEDGSGNTQDVIKAINYAVDNGASIINFSFVGNTYDPNLELAIQRAYQKGLVIVAAAGNENFQGGATDLDFYKMYPVCHKGPNGENIIIGVGASDENDKLSEFSNYGSSCVDVIAPGQDFFGALVYNPAAHLSQSYGGDFSGTSLSAPIVSGVAALMKSYRPSLTNQEIMDLILNNTDNIDQQNPDFAGQMGKGLIDPVKIFQSLKATRFSSSLIRGSGEAVYYYALDGKRYVFPDDRTYLSWYDDFSGVKQISDEDLAVIPLGGIVTYRPGSLVKIISDPNVYAVAKGGTLRWITTPALAESLYGKNWQDLVSDVSDAFFINYKSGEPINNVTDFNPFVEKNEIISIDIDKGLL